MAVGLFCSRRVAGLGHLNWLRVSRQSGRAEQELYLRACDAGNEYFDGTCDDECLCYELGDGCYAGIAGDGHGGEYNFVQGGGRADGDGESALADQCGDGGGGCGRGCDDVTREASIAK